MNTDLPGDRPTVDDYADQRSFGQGFAEAEPPEAEMPRFSESEDTAATALEFVRRVADQVRERHQQVESVAKNAHRIAEKAVFAMQAAEERARLAESATATALARAERAEAQLRLSTQETAQAKDQERSGGVDDWLKQAHLSLLRMSESRTRDPAG